MECAMCLLEALHDQLFASTYPTLINLNMIRINDKYFKSQTSPSHLFLLLLNNLLHKKYLYAASLHVGAHNGQNSRNSISILTICYLIVSCLDCAGLAW